MTGRVIAGRYNLQHPIGRGAMGVVWRARDQLLDREVAIKEVVISALISADERHNAYQRTLREARTAARLSHRGVVTVYDVVEEDGRPWIVMELVPSQSLDQVLTVEGRLPTARAGRIGQQLLSALAAAHAAGVLHRDVKPSNVLIATNRTGEGWDERAVLTDFGIAQFEGDPRLTQTGMVMGSPGFTAPERIRGGDATPGSDLWSLGATIYAAVEGRGPYEQRGGAITTMSAIINEDAPIAPHAGKLAPIIAALLRREPSGRPTASAAARMFAQVLPQLAEAAEEPPAQTHPPTIRSAYVPAPAAPVASKAVTAAEDADAQAADDPLVTGRPAAEAAPAPAAATPASADPAGEAAPAAKAVPAASAMPAAGAAKAVPAGIPAPAGKAAAAASALPSGKAVAEKAAPAGNVAPAGKAEAPDAVLPAGKADAEAESVAKADPPTVPGNVPAKAASAKAPAAEAAPAEAADQKAAGAVLPEARSAASAARTPGGETAIPEQSASGYQPTELAIPVARGAQAATPAPPKPTVPKPAQNKPAQPGPRFTAANQAERAAPSFSAASPARPATPPDARPPYSSGGTGQGGYPPAGGSTTPYPPSAYPPPSGGQYAGPAQPYPDLARQYTPGSGGGRTDGGGGRSGRGSGGRRIVWLVVAVLIAAAVGVGAALALNNHGGNGSNTAGSGGTGDAENVPDTPSGLQSVDALNNPSTAMPDGWWPASLQASDLNSTAGFSLDLPPGWKETRKGLATDFTGPGDLLVEVDVTPQTTDNMLAAATGLEHQRATVAHAFPGYKRDTLKGVPVRNTNGAVWKFTWTPAGKPEYVADDILFRKQTSAGAQDYAIYIRSPQSTFGKTALPLFNKILRTFQTIPATTTQPPVTTSPSASAS
jgi:tRNA A-37 threonylcarbamoyl transferase component Bud32